MGITTPPVPVSESDPETQDPAALTPTVEHVTDAAAGAADAAVQLLEALPFQAHITMAVVLLAGLALWSFGAKLIKPAFALLGLSIGGLVGLMVPPLLGVEQVAGVGAWLIGLGAGAVIGLVVALVLLKIAITLSAGVALAVAGFFGGLVYLDLNPIDGRPIETTEVIEVDPSTAEDRRGLPGLFRDPDTRDIVLRSITGNDEDPAPVGDGSTAEVSFEDRVLEIAERVRLVATQAWTYATDRWGDLAQQERVILLGTTSASFAIGLLGGLVMPRRSSAVVTAMLGAAIWLIGAVWLIQGVQIFAPARGLVTDVSPTAWAIVLGVTSIIGFVAQAGGLAKKKPRKKSEDSDD